MTIQSRIITKANFLPKFSSRHAVDRFELLTQRLTGSEGARAPSKESFVNING